MLASFLLIKRELRDSKGLVKYASCDPLETWRRFEAENCLMRGSKGKVFKSAITFVGE